VHKEQKVAKAGGCFCVVALLQNEKVAHVASIFWDNSIWQ
jgi:hypothetical protein